MEENKVSDNTKYETEKKRRNGNNKGRKAYSI